MNELDPFLSTSLLSEHFTTVKEKELRQCSDLSWVELKDRAGGGPGWVSTHLPLCGLSCVPHDLNIDVLVIKVNVFEDRTL